MGAKSLRADLALGGAALVGAADKLDLNTYGSLLNLPVIVSIVTIVVVTTIFQFFLQYYFSNESKKCTSSKFEVCSFDLV